MYFFGIFERTVDFFNEFVSEGPSDLRKYALMAVRGLSPAHLLTLGSNKNFKLSNQTTIGWLFVMYSTITHSSSFY